MSASGQQTDISLRGSVPACPEIPEIFLRQAETSMGPVLRLSTRTALDWQCSKHKHAWQCRRIDRGHLGILSAVQMLIVEYLPRREMVDVMRNAGNFIHGYSGGLLYSYFLTIPPSVAANMAFPQKTAAIGKSCRWCSSQSITIPSPKAASPCPPPTWT